MPEYGSSARSAGSYFGPCHRARLVQGLRQPFNLRCFMSIGAGMSNSDGSRRFLIVRSDYQPATTFGPNGIFEVIKDPVTVIKLGISGSIDPVVVLISTRMQEPDDRGPWHSSSFDLDGPVVVMLDDGSADGLGIWSSPIDECVLG